MRAGSPDVCVVIPRRSKASDQDDQSSQRLTVYGTSGGRFPRR